jgi:hypothetical protein
VDDLRLKVQKVSMHYERAVLDSSSHSPDILFGPTSAATRSPPVARHGSASITQGIGSRSFMVPTQFPANGTLSSPSSSQVVAMPNPRPPPPPPPPPLIIPNPRPPPTPPFTLPNPRLIHMPQILMPWVICLNSHSQPLMARVLVYGARYARNTSPCMLLRNQCGFG